MHSTPAVTILPVIIRTHLQGNRCENTPPLSEMASSSLLSSLRALSLRAAPAVRQVLRTRQTTRNISQTVLAPSTTARPTTTTISTTRAAQAITQQQTRGMKVHSSVKKRCEHCKVSHQFHQYPLRPRARDEGFPYERTAFGNMALEFRHMITEQSIDLENIAGCEKKSRQATSWLSLYHLQREPET
ncbi:hypothetical protein F4818DRAFT_132620 [Hypoxylon cercidicola]|nr:hypothetical protein F4818DRAFT_132620 [Hypoxylon cercidicola]